jgi:hypothetical protein
VWKNIESIYKNGFPNDDLESEFRNTLRDALLFRISCYPKIENENGSLECTQDMETIREWKDVEGDFFLQRTLQMII